MQNIKTYNMIEYNVKYYRHNFIWFVRQSKGYSRFLLDHNREYNY
ncbi:hypothetical protein PBCV1_a393aL [Paramecium bursaria Chlorella virus 1]|uniref:Uncharacterized protein n=1 Tax=Paramecium bursaria Chlorella virus 1 TaxID=10506 RepID=F8TU30_PBCV1|nr:hypothetical protein PBCV1_a393aL [Paramecium bursaria Chlorella virus 1]AEI70091.1 hypothetical protein [Paramecium bursaria Chlorella virus 1]